MKKGIFGRLGSLLLAGVVTSAIIAAVAIAASNGGPPAGTPPTPNGTPAGQITLTASSTPFAVSSVQWGAGAGISNSDPPQISDPSFSEFMFTKPVDANSFVLLNALVAKTVFPKVVLTQTWGSGASAVFEMTNAAISGESQSSGGGQPSESFSVHYSKLKWTYRDAAGSVTGQN